MITYLRPIIAQIRGTQILDAFEELGEPVATKHLCEAGVKSLFGHTTTPLDSVPVIIEGKTDPVRDRDYLPFYLTKCRSGLYMMTALRPVACKVNGTNEIDAFEKAGEPIAIRHICELLITLIFDKATADIKIAEPVKIQIRAEILE